MRIACLKTALSRAACAATSLTLLSGCAVGTTLPATSLAPQKAFMARLNALCDKAFAGRLVTNETPDAAMVGVPMLMHVRSCSDSETRIPFHVSAADGSWDRSRTWVITRTSNGLRLKHDHRHKDGSPDAVTMYGGDTADDGTATRQDFRVDAESVALFRANNLPKSVTNIWAVEVDETRFAYELRRTGEHARHFRVEFDLTKPVRTPAPPWE